MIRADSKLFALLCDTLRPCIGPDKALTIGYLGVILGLPSRRHVEELLETRLQDLPFPIVSGSSGIFRPASAEDLNHYERSLVSRIRCLAIRRRTVLRKSVAEGFTREGRRFISAPIQLALFSASDVRKPFSS